MLEAPVFHADGNLYCVDVLMGQIYRVDASGNFSLLVRYDGNPSGLAAHPDGSLYIADRRKGLLKLDPATGRIDPALDAEGSAPFQRLSDLVIAPDGDIYITDQGSSDLANPCGRVYRLRAGDRLDLLLDGLAGPNGIEVDAARRKLYVAVMRANDVIRADLLPKGGLGRVQNFVRLSGGGGPDGLGLDHKGRLAVAHYQFGTVWQFDERGEARVRVRLAGGECPTSVTYKGPDKRTMYITEAETGTIQVAEIPPDMLD
jgi:gluconolactonase